MDPCRNRLIPFTAAAALCLAVALPTAAQAPLRVGDHVPIRIASHGDSDIEAMATPGGRTFRLTHPGATYIALHFEVFDLAPGAELRVSDAGGGQSFLLRGRGKMEAGTFWARHVKGDTVVLELSARGQRAGYFLVDEYAAGFVSLGGPEAICGTDDKDNAVCFQSSHPTEYDRGRAVARLLIQGSSLCTGWLASADDHLITNEHCISSSSAALNTDYEFMAEAPSCGDFNCQLCHAGTVFSGATFIQDNAALDYALVQINSGNPAATYGFLEIDNRDAVIGEEIYIPQHPGGRAKEFGIDSSHSSDANGVCHVLTFEPGCSSAGYQDVGYMCDTEGGSSGSPVLARSSHQVIALHHCANCENRGVPIDLVCAEVCDLLGPACTVNADCDDGDACTGDVCNAGSCENTPLANCCGNGTCESGEDCNSCAADCISGTGSGAACGNGVCEAGDGEDCLTCPSDCNGKQNGRPSGRFCCGFGGENPVGCADAACTGGGFQCTETPASGDPFCCGDGGCTGDEDPVNCDLDCDPPSCGDGTCDAGEDPCSCAADCGIPPANEQNCADGADDDCDGAVDCADADCSGDPACAGCNLGQPGDSCSSDADCCSNKCRGRPGARTCR